MSEETDLIDLLATRGVDREVASRSAKDLLNDLKEARARKLAAQINKQYWADQVDAENVIIDKLKSIIE